MAGVVFHLTLFYDLKLCLPFLCVVFHIRFVRAQGFQRHAERFHTKHYQTVYLIKHAPVVCVVYVPVEYLVLIFQYANDLPKNRKFCVTL